MARRVAIPALIVLAAAVVLGVLPYLTAKREVTALTPAVPPLPPGSLVPAGINPGSRLCIRDLPFSPDGQVARVMTATGGKPGPAFVMRAQGPGYDASTTVPAGWKEGALEIPIRPPAQPLRGSLCFVNTSRSQFAVMASGVGQKLARPTPYLDAQPLQQDVPLVFDKAKPASMLNRAGALVDHAAVFSPLPAWLIWILIACALLVVPAAAIGALAVAARSGPAPVQAATPAAVPGAGLARRAREAAPVRRARGAAGRIPPWVFVAGIVVLAWAFAYFWARRVTTFAPDETLYVAIANWLPHHLPQGLFYFDFYQRGVQRLEIWLLSATLGVFGSPGGFKLAHLLDTLAFASSAVPAYLVARGLDVRKWLAVIAGVLVVAVPWTVLMTSVLTEPLAYPAFAWSVWATWRAVRDPRPATELTALAFVVVALLSRSIFLVLFALLPVSVFVQEARFGSLRPGTFVRRHGPVVALVVLGVVALILSVTGVLPPTSKLTGQYGTKLTIDISALLNQDSFWASRAVVGTGFIPFVLGGAWIVSELVRPRDQRGHAFALVSVVSVLLLIYASKSPPGLTYVDERYMMYLAPLLAIGCVVAFDRHQLRVPAVIAAGLFAAWLVRRQGWNPAGEPTEYFTAPAEVFYARVGLLRLQQYVPTWLALRDAAFLLFAIGTAVCAYAMSRRPHAGTVRAVLLAALLLVQLAQAQYAIAKYVNGAGGRYQATLDQRAWIDRALAGKPGDAALFETGIGTTGDFDYIWTGTQFWNRRVTGEYGLNGPPGPTVTLGDFAGVITFDQTTGRVKAQPPLPAYMVLPRDYVQAEPAGEPILRPLYNGLDLWRVDKPDRLVFGIANAQQDGVLTQDQPATIRFYAGSQPPGQRCAEIPIKGASAAAGPTPPIPYRIGPRHGTIPPGGQINVEVPLRFGGKPYLDVPVKVRGKVQTFGGRTYAARLLIITTGPCTGG
jgi:hypothetical protein